MPYKSRGNKIRTIEELKEGEIYLISSPDHADTLIKVNKQHSGEISASILVDIKNNISKNFNWNRDFVMSEDEIFSVA